MNDYEKMLEKAHDGYLESVALVAQVLFEEVVKPYCIVHKLNYRAPGLGDDWGFFVTKESKKEFETTPFGYGKIKNECLPEEVVKALNLPIPGTRNEQPIGSYLPTFIWKEFKDGMFPKGGVGC